MSNTSLGMRWLVRSAITALVVFVGLSALPGPVANAGPGEDKMTVLPASQASAVGGSFSVFIEASTDEADFQGYQDAISFNPAIVQATNVVQLMPGTLTTCGAKSIDNTLGKAYDNGCTAISAIGPFTGNVTRIDMTCVATGVSPLHLISVPEDPDYGSALMTAWPIGWIIPDLYDGSVTCLGMTAVGGIAELPDMAGASAGEAAAPAGGSGWSAGGYAALAGTLAAAAIAIAAGAWYARRWWQP